MDRLPATRYLPGRRSTRWEQERCLSDSWRCSTRQNHHQANYRSCPSSPVPCPWSCHTQCRSRHAPLSSSQVATLFRDEVPSFPNFLWLPTLCHTATTEWEELPRCSTECQLLDRLRRRRRQCPLASHLRTECRAPHSLRCTPAAAPSYQSNRCRPYSDRRQWCLNRERRDGGGRAAN